MTKNKYKIWLSSPNMGGREEDFVKEAFNKNWIAPIGPNIDAFEKDICRYNNVNHAAALSSGTSGIHLALILLGVKSGDEVLCSSFTFSASANPIRYQLATPIFVDSEEETWNIDPILLEKAIIDRTKIGIKPKALILVHLYGVSAKIDEILSICEKYEIDFNVKCSLNNNHIYCEIESTLTDIQLAYYLYVNGEKADQIWYSDNRKVSFKTENLLINDFEVVFFMKNKEGMIYTKSIKKNTNWSLCQGIVEACELLCDKDSVILEIGI